MYSRFIVNIWGAILHFTSYHSFFYYSIQFSKKLDEYQLLKYFLCIIIIFIAIFASTTILLYGSFNMNIMLLILMNIKYFHFNICICEKMCACYFVNLYFLVPSTQFPLSYK